MASCVDTFTTAGGTTLFATGFLFENTKPSEYELFIQNNVTVTHNGTTENIEIGDAWIRAEGIEMPSNTKCLSIIMSGEGTSDPYILGSQKITISIGNIVTGELKHKTYTLETILPH